MSAKVYAFATLDTKGEELAYVVNTIKDTGLDVVVVDIGTRETPSLTPDITREEVAQRHPRGIDAVLERSDRGEAVSAMADALEVYLDEIQGGQGVSGVIAIGGSGGTAIVAPAFQRLPVGIPKLIVSTVASGQVAPYVGCTDMTLMYSVVDVAGLNAVSRRVLANAAYAIAGMVKQPPLVQDARPTVAMTMFGVTTPCVTQVRERLETEGFDCLVFHATGAGGRAMEKLVASGLVQGVLDITTTEVADEIVGGVFPAGADRMDVILQSNLPYLVSVGALDMVNFNARETVPEKFHDRKFHVHNAQVTLMRTNKEENRLCGYWIGNKLNQGEGPWKVLLPERGVSMLDADGEPFNDPEARSDLFNSMEQTATTTSHRSMQRLPLHINDPQFAEEIVNQFLGMIGRGND